MRLLNLPAITTALAASYTKPAMFASRPLSISLLGVMLVGTGGSTIDAYVQSSFDGVLWFDLANFHWVNTPSELGFNLNGQTVVTTQRTVAAAGNLSANTSLDGIWGTQFRVQYVTTGTYSGGTSVTVDMATDLA